MKIITISREFGSGGREFSRRLADVLDFDYYDKEIINAISLNKGMDKNYVNRIMEKDERANIPLTFGKSFAGIFSNSTQTELLLEQKKVIEEIAKAENNCVIVGRNADVLLSDYKPFNIFVCADMDSKIDRCLKHVREDESRDVKNIKKKIYSIDKNRIQLREFITDKIWGEPANYHLTLNTSNWDLKELALTSAEFIKSWYKGLVND